MWTLGGDPPERLQCYTFRKGGGPDWQDMASVQFGINNGKRSVQKPTHIRQIGFCIEIEKDRIEEIKGT